MSVHFNVINYGKNNNNLCTDQNLVASQKPDHDVPAYLSMPGEHHHHSTVFHEGISWNPKNIFPILTKLNNYISLIKKINFLISVEDITILKQST